MTARFSFRALVRAFVTAVGIAIVAAPVTGVAQSRPDTTFTLSRNALVDITVRAGYLVVRGTDRDDAELRTSGTGYTLKSSAVGVVIASARNIVSNSFNGSTRRPTSSRDSDDARVELTVPRGSRVVINAGRADVELRAIDGDVEVHSSSGDINLMRLGGRAIVETLSGDLLIDEGVRDLRVTSSNGDVIVHGLRGSANVHTTSGDVTLSGASVPNVTIESISGDVAFEGSIASDGRFQMSSHSGDLVLRLAENSRGTVEFFTHNGEMTTTIPLTMSGSTADLRNRDNRPGQRFVFGGGGSALFSISTFNGDVRIERGSSRSTDR
jgi:hypothetical protein